MATTVPLDYQMLIDGELVDSDGGRFSVTNPATGEEIATVPNATVDDVKRAIDSADRALVGWRQTPAGERSRILRAAAAGIRAEADHIGGVMTDEQGKPLAEAKGEVEYAAAFLDWFAGEAERIYGADAAVPRRREAHPRAAPAGRRRPRRSRRGTSRSR